MRLPIHQVRLGGLFPRFKTDAPDFTLDNAGVKRLTAFVMAIREINNKTDGIADNLLPNTELLFAVRDSKRDAASAFKGARQLALETFGGLGVSAVIGAASSDPSMMAALALKPLKTPQISYASTSAELSDGERYEYFLRTPPSDAFQARGLADLAKNLFGYSRVAAVSSRDSYGADGIAAFLEAAREQSITVLAHLSFEKGETDFSKLYAALAASRARVIVLFCGSHDATAFLEGAYDSGIGGEGYVWLGSDAVSNPDTMTRVSDSTKRMAIFKGFFGLTPTRGAGTEAYDAFAARISALPLTNGTHSPNGTLCDLEVSDDLEASDDLCQLGSESRLLWAADHDGDPSTPLKCAGVSDKGQDSYAPFVYDAVFAVAHALHLLIEVGELTPTSEASGRSVIDGDKRAPQVNRTPPVSPASLVAPGPVALRLGVRRARLSTTVPPTQADGCTVAECEL